MDTKREYLENQVTSRYCDPITKAICEKMLGFDYLTASTAAESICYDDDLLALALSAENAIHSVLDGARIDLNDYAYATLLERAKLALELTAAEIATHYKEN